jgi:hypothetical protein
MGRTGRARFLGVAYLQGMQKGMMATIGVHKFVACRVFLDLTGFVRN